MPIENPRFCVGQTARLLQSVINRSKSIPCEVLQIMPFDGVCFQYRVKGEDERFDRIAREHELAEIVTLQAETTPSDSTERFPPVPKQAMKGKG